MSAKTAAKQVKLSRAQESTLRAIVAMGGTAPRSFAGVAPGFYVNSLPALERAGMIERYQDEEVTGDDLMSRLRRDRVRVVPGVVERLDAPGAPARAPKAATVKLSGAQVTALRYWSFPAAAPCYRGGNKATLKSLVRRGLLDEPRGMMGHEINDAGLVALAAFAA